MLGKYNGVYYEVQVKSVRQDNYWYIPKDKITISDRFLLCYLRFADDKLPDVCNHVRVADMSSGKAREDGYRGVHVYFQLSAFHYPIEIQYNTYYDRQNNHWLHKYVYKRGYGIDVGCALRRAYEAAKIRNENEFYVGKLSGDICGEV